MWLHIDPALTEHSLHSGAGSWHTPCSQCWQITAYPGKSHCGLKTKSCPPRYLATTLVNGRRHKVLGGDEI